MKADRVTEILEFEVPKPQKGAVVMEVLKANVCGSDIHIWEGKHVLKNHVMGHEMMGRIHELGEGVTTDYAGQPVKVGDRIVPVYYLVCHKCRNCQNGLYNICEHGNDLASQPAAKPPHFTGAFGTHYYIAPGQHFYKIPDEVPDDMAAGANCGITQMIYALEKAGLHNGLNVVIQGAGGLGLFASAISHESGAFVIAIDSVDARLEEIRKFGVDRVIDMKNFKTIETRKDEIGRLTQGRGADLVVEVAGVPAAFNESLRLVRPGGTVLEIGNVLIKEEFNISIVPGFLVRHCINVMGLVRYLPSYLHKGLLFLEKNHDKYPFGGMSDRYYTLDETQLAIERSARREVQRATIAPNQ
jgi:D-arabinose 1-dehydrogenase-like Zn-dependent alcohol dehydrogenase